MKKVFTYKDIEPIKVNCWADVQIFCADKYSIQAFQVQLEPDTKTVILTNKLGETFATVGHINFDV